VQGHVDDVKSMAAKQPRIKVRAADTPKPVTQTPKPADQGPLGGARTGAAADSARQGDKTSSPDRETDAAAKKVVEPASPVEIVVDDAEATSGGTSGTRAQKRAVPARAASASDPSSPSGSSSEEEDPSLRELFWGED
jgi:hypothetical protein